MGGMKGKEPSERKLKLQEDTYRYFGGKSFCFVEHRLCVYPYLNIAMTSIIFPMILNYRYILSPISHKNQSFKKIAVKGQKSRIIDS